MLNLQWTVSRGRILLAAFLALACAGALFSRLVAIQVLAHERFEARAEQNQEGRVLLPARRGDFLDKNGVLLASDVSTYSVHAVPRLMPDPAAAARRLAAALELDAARLSRDFARRPRFCWVHRKLDPERAAAVQKLGLPGVFWNHEPRREYPGGSASQQVTGKVNLDGHGVEGLEYQYDALLSGESGWATYTRDGAGGRVLLPRNARREPTHGRGLVLTLDAEMQGAVMNRLEEAVRETGARQASAVVLDPHSGAIWALGAAGPGAEGAHRQAVVSDTYEPGSTFKMVVAAAVLEEGLAGTGTHVHAEHGSYNFGGFSIRDVHGYGDLTLADAFRYSSNIVAGKLSLLLGAERFYHYATSFGFGSLTGIDFPGEVGGRLRAPRQWSNRSLPTLAIGQELSVTPLQLAAAYAVVANGGMLMKPYLVQAELDPEGRVARRIAPEPIRRVLTEATAATLRGMLRAVVDSGTARKASLEWAAVAGKTGTAQKYDPALGTYSRSKFVSSFVGIVPAEEPKLVCLVQVDEPARGHYGGEIAAPVFRRILEDLRRIPEGPLSPRLHRVQVLPAEFAPPPSEVPDVRLLTAERARRRLAEHGFRVRERGHGTRVLDQKPEAGHRAGRGEWVEIVLEPAGSGSLPDVVGLTLREAIDRLSRIGVRSEVVGSGIVVTQFPPAGSYVERTGTCLLRCLPAVEASGTKALGGRRGD
jgi:cell division protein FtsI (penicillin-binding protein 3)